MRKSARICRDNRLPAGGSGKLGREGEREIERGRKGAINHKVKRSPSGFFRFHQNRVQLAGISRFFLPAVQGIIVLSRKILNWVVTNFQQLRSPKKALVSDSFIVVRICVIVFENQQSKNASVSTAASNRFSSFTASLYIIALT